jgi:membrane peptidoglycan carboxypeptidase
MRSTTRRIVVPAARRGQSAAALVRRVHRKPERHPRSVATIVAAVAGAIVLAVSIVLTAGAGLAGLVAVTSISALSADLPDPAELGALSFTEPTIIYDRTGKTELARFQQLRRVVLTYDDIPPLVLDATTAAEDRTFWTNEGFDLPAMADAAIDTLNGNGRGASTITQQLVRARLLPEEVTAPGADVYVRKAKEVIQAARLTQAFPGESGKQQIITAYLNEIFYGHDAYGIAAAANAYFGITDLRKLTFAQAALLAGLPQSPSTLDPYRFAKPDKDGRLVVPQDAAPVVRRNWILSNLTAGRWTRLTPTDIQAAQQEPVVLRGDRPIIFRAAHFSWQVRRELMQILGSQEAVETGGYRVITTLDWPAQQLAEATVAAAVVAPNLPQAQASSLLSRLKVPRGDRAWSAALRGKDLHNAALVAIDYRTGDVRAYVGSAGYYRENLASRRFNPKFDAAGDGTRQPGSAFKPVLYAAAFERKKLTPGSLLLDITTTFAPRQRWAPRDADQLERGPVLVRNALQMSLNIPAIRALQRVGNDAVADTAERLGLRFAGGKKAFLQSGLAGAVGTVEVRPLDLVSAFGTLANGGLHRPPRMILEIRDRTGRVVWRPTQEPTRAVSATTAFLITDILAGNTDASVNRIWAEKLALFNGPGGQRRPAAVKTGTANDARDLSTYGYLAPPKNPKAPAWAVGVWLGNSDHSTPRSRDPAISLTAAAPMWRSFMRRLTDGDPIATFRRPKGIVEARIDAWSGGRPGPWTHDTKMELFRAGTQPGAKGQVDPNGLLYSTGCGGWVVDPLKAELGPSAWDDDVANWMARARRGVGVGGSLDSRTAYFWGRTGWGGRIAGPCVAPKPDKPPKDQQPGHGGKPKPPGHPGRGNGGDPSPTPPAAPEAIALPPDPDQLPA